MYKYSILIFLTIFQTTIFASWVEDYQKGFFEKKENFFYSMVRVNTNTLNYQKIAFNNAVSDISTQIYSKVSSKQSSFKKLENDNYSIGFNNQINIESNIPIFGAKVINTEIKNGIYYILVSLDGNKMGLLYTKECNNLSNDINSLFKRFKKTKDIKTKEQLLNLIKQKFTKFSKFSTIASLLVNSSIKKPEIQSYIIDTEFAKLYKKNAKNIDELSSLLANRLSDKKITGSLQILPFSYLDKNTYSLFSAELKNYLEIKLNSKYQITKKYNSNYKLLGSYSINKNILTVKAEITDYKGDIISISLVKMKLPKKHKKSYYIPKQNEYKNMNNVVLNDNLNIQGRINGRKSHLLFEEGESIRIEAKVSKESYIYVIANIRLKNGNQAQYLLPINESNGLSQYIKLIPYQNSNLWINLGEFEVSAPFGIEFLQIFASNINPVYNLPNVATQEIDGEVFEGVILNDRGELMSPTKSMIKVRGLKRKKKAKKAPELSEYILKFTTIPGK